MIHVATVQFWQAYDHLPESIQQLADSKYVLLKQDPTHPSLHFKQIGRFWSVRIGLHYRALGVASPGRCIWFWIGTHTDYDRLIKQQGQG